MGVQPAARSGVPSPPGHLPAAGADNAKGSFGGAHDRLWGEALADGREIQDYVQVAAVLWAGILRLHRAHTAFRTKSIDNQ